MAFWNLNAITPFGMEDRLDFYIRQVGIIIIIFNSSLFNLFLLGLNRRNRLRDVAHKVFPSRFTQGKQLRGGTLKICAVSIFTIAESAPFIYENRRLDLLFGPRCKGEIHITLPHIHVLFNCLILADLGTRGLVVITLKRMSRLPIDIILL